MSLDSGFDAQTPSLPPGGGAVSGLGETFSPDLSTGTGSYTVRFDLPNGPNDIGPRLSLRYDTAAGNGPFGLGFSLPLPRLLRATATRFPRYDGTDALVLEGAGELVSLGGGAYRPQVDGGAWRIQAQGDGFRVTDREGLHYFFGTAATAQLSDPANGSHVFAWHLERIEDALGNAATFTWQRDGAQLYLSRVAYGAYEVQLQYEPRPDVVRWGRAGFLIATALRCTQVELRLPAEAQPVLRRWRLAYTEDPANGCSLLTGVTLSGLDKDGTALSAPPLRLGYSAFQTRELIRFQNVDDGAAPGPLTHPVRRAELVDWDGDGLPDLLDVGSGGRARLWPNLGNCTWGRPHTVADLPWFASSTAAVGFADMNGDGMADLIRLDRPLAGYVPRGAAGFERPITWRSAPALAPLAPNARFIDLDGDGVVDLLTSSPRALTLYYRDEEDGWAAQPQVVTRSQAPDVDLDDPHVFLADMTGDGSLDVVRVTGSAVVYWPYLGNGRWGDLVQMAGAPALPFDVTPQRLLLSDVDGDGCADLIYLDRGRVVYWINQCGGAFSAPHVIEYVPAGPIADVRLADMRGSGTAGLLWAATNRFQGDTTYFYLDFTGGAKPHLLTTIDNGIGQVAEIAYSTSAQQAVLDARVGQPWSSRLPIAIPVVSTITVTETSTGVVSTTGYRYHEGRFDGLLREFAGFGRVDEDQMGDQTSPTLRTTTWFHTGVDPAQPNAALTADERRQRRAIRGRIYRQERLGLDGTADEARPYDRLDQVWTVSTVPTSGGTVYLPRLAQSVRSTFERAAAACAVITTNNLAWDANGSVLESVQTSEAPGDPAQTRTLRTLNQVAVDPAGRFVARVWRIQQFDGAGTRVADTITEFDAAAEGVVGTHGLVTKKSALALTDALAAEVYGGQLPDFATLGYSRRPGEDGWWELQTRYERSETATTLQGRVTGPTGAVTTFDFDANKTYPVRVVDPRGNTISAEHDYRTCRVTRIVDASGATYAATYDALSRLDTSVEPGDTPALPTTSYLYDTSALPASVTAQRRAVTGATDTIDTRELYDGAGRLLERRVRDDAGEVVESSQVYSARGHLARSFVTLRPASAAYQRPDDAWPHMTLAYDALGRQTRQVNPDGSQRVVSYGPLVVVEADEEDTRTDAGGTHAGTPTRKRLDPTGRVSAIEENLAGRTLRSTYEYDLKGNLIRHVDALGNVVRLWYDLLGRTLRVERPEHSTLSVFDAAGNAVEARSSGGTLVLREFDPCNRPVAVRYGSAAAAPAIQFTYHDAGAPAPPDAGTNTVGGRCARIDDEGGTTILDYDQRGRLVLKRSRPAGGGQTFDLTFRYRSDGQLDSVVYPDGGAGRRVIQYQYNRRGAVSSVPSVITAIEYDLTGRRTRVRYANGTEQRYTYDLATHRLSDAQLTGPSGVLRSVQYTLDLVGNPLRIESPDPKLAATYTYDDLYRLVEAHGTSGESWTYGYDDAGNLTHKSDVGDYHYGEGGAPATCLTSAGSQTFTYTPLGEMQGTPWGQQTFDPMGRLTRIVGAGGGQIDFRYDYAGVRVAAHTSNGAAPAVDRLTPDALYSVESGTLTLNVFDGEGLCARIAPGGILYLHADHLGSLVLATDGAGAEASRLRYDAYGAVLETTGPAAPPPLGFTGGAPDVWTGLLYLNARYYHPGLGRFVSPDAVVQHVLDPVCWSPYVYCRGNPVAYVDPTGRGFWGIFLAALAIVALIVVVVICVVLDVFTFGAATPGVAALIGVGIVAVGAIVGGVVGGLAAAAKGGNTEDIITGVLVGAAVGGWAAFASCFAGAGVASGIGLHGFWGAVVAGAVNGAISGAAIGFAAGYAGGKGTLQEIWTKVWQGALVGLVVGAVLGGASYLISPPTGTLQSAVQQSLNTPQPSAPAAAPAPSTGMPALPPAYTTSPGQALQTVGTGLAGKVGGAVAEYAARAILTSPAAAFADAVVVDLSVGAWDLGYVPALLHKLGVVNVSGTF